MGKFLAYFRARVLLANMSKKGNDFTVILRIAKQRNIYRTVYYYTTEMPHSENIAKLAISSSIMVRVCYELFN